MYIRSRLVLIFFLYGQTLAVKKLNILGLFPMYGPWTSGQAVRPAVEIAIDYVNRDPNILPGYKLKIVYFNTKCNPGVGLFYLISQVCSKYTFIMLLGPGCSPVSEIVAIGADYLNIVQVSYGTTSPVMSNIDRYPSFFRLVNSQYEDNDPRIAFLKHFNWTKVTLLYHSEQFLRLMIEDIQNIMIQENFTIIGKHLFTHSPKESLRLLKEDDARIIIGGFYEDKAREVFCEAFKIKFGGPKIVWILPGFFGFNWWKEYNDVDCTTDQILWAVGNYFTIHVYLKSSGNDKDDNGITREEFMNDYNSITNHTKLPGYKFLLAGYDAVWVIARALNATMTDLQNTGYRLEDFSYNNSYMGDLIMNNTSKVKFKSLSGQVVFDKYGDSVRWSRIKQFQDRELVTIALYKKLDSGNVLIWDNFTPVFWEDGMVPKDSLEKVTSRDVLLVSLYIIMCLLSALGILLALSLLSFNIKFRKQRIIEMSTPNINNIILLGCILANLYVFIPPEFCQVRLYILILALSILQGALFAKLWRVYIIFTKVQTLQKWVLEDYSLFITIGVIVGINLSILILWAIFSPRFPTDVQVDNMTKNNPTDDRIIVLIVRICKSKSEYDDYFKYTVIVFQSIILLFGVFMTFTTRKMRIITQSDFKATGMCICNMTVIAVIGFLITTILKQRVNYQYGLECFLIVGVSTVTQCLIFIPKILALQKGVVTKSSLGRLAILLNPAVPITSDSVFISESSKNSSVK